MFVPGQGNERPTCNANLRGEPRSLRTQRFFGDLHHQALAFEELFFDGEVCRASTWGSARFHRGAGVPNICHVQESRTVEADVDEGRLDSRQHPHHLAEVHIADDPALHRAFDMQFL